MHESRAKWPANEPHPRLRIVSEDCGDAAPPQYVAGEFSPWMTLTEFFATKVLPEFLNGRSDRTIAEYEVTMKNWAKITSDPPLCKITTAHTKDFVVGLPALISARKEETASDWTVRKHCRNLQTCLDMAGPYSTRSPATRAAEELIARVPWVEKPEAEDDPVEDNFELAEIEQILQATPRMKRPLLPGTGIRPPMFWLNLVALFYGLGERRGAFLRVTFADVDDDNPTKHPYGQLHFPRRTRKKKRRAHRVPLTADTRAAMLRMLPRGMTLAEAAQARVRILPYPNGARQFDRQWQRLLRLAQIPERRRFGVHGLRKATATEAARFSLLAAQLLLGHSDPAVTQRHYVNRGIVDETVHKLPQPETLQLLPKAKRLRDTSGADQRRLPGFDE